MNKLDNFIEAFSKDDANRVDLELYTFVSFTDTRGYIFKKRAKKARGETK